MTRVVLLEDDPLVRFLVSEMLSSDGCEVKEASTAADALGAIQRGAVDLLVTDIRMPGPMNGWELAEEARRLCPNLPVLYVSGFSAGAIRSVPGAAYLPKPFSRAGLTRAVGQALGAGLSVAAYAPSFAA